MLRKRSTRPVTSKQAVVGDHSNSPWQPPEKSTKSTSFFLTSPSFFKRFFNSCSKDYIDPMMSPTSILDTKPFSAVAHFWVAENTTKNPTTLSKNEQHSWEQTNNTKGIGLALIDENSETNNNLNNNSTTTKQQKRKLVVFGSQLRIQVPPMPNSSVFPCFSPESPKEFGIKTPRNNFWPFGNKDTLSQVHPEESVSPISGNGNLNMSEIEQSEDYTCVISHGPNPKTTHIFGNCIVESCCGVVGGGSFGTARRNVLLSSSGNSTPSSLEHENFLSFCHHCKKKLGEGNDIYMYRGEKAFCSQECRCQEMLFDDGVEN